MLFKIRTVEVSPDNRFIALFYNLGDKLAYVSLIENKGFGIFKFLNKNCFLKNIAYSK